MSESERTLNRNKRSDRKIYGTTFTSNNIFKLHSEEASTSLYLVHEYKIIKEEKYWCKYK